MANVDVAVITKQLGDPCAMKDIQGMYPDVKVTKLRRELKNQGWGSTTVWNNGRSNRVWGSVEKQDLQSGNGSGLDSIVTLMLNKGYSLEDVERLLKMRQQYSIANEFAPLTNLSEIHEAAESLHRALLKLDIGGRLAFSVWETRYMKAALFVRVWDDSFPEIERTQTYHDAVNRKHKYAFKCDDQFVQKLGMISHEMSKRLRWDFIFTYCPEYLPDHNKKILDALEAETAPCYMEQWESLAANGELPIVPKERRLSFDERRNPASRMWGSGYHPARGPVGEWFVERYDAGLETSSLEKGEYKPQLFRFETPVAGIDAAGA